MSTKKLFQCCVPEPLRFVHAFCGTLLMYLAVYGVGYWLRIKTELVEEFICLLQMFISSAPLVWYSAFLANDIIFTSELRGKFSFYAYSAMQAVALAVHGVLFWFWLEAYLTVNPFYIWDIFFFLVLTCSYILWVILLTYILAKLRIFPLINMFGK